ncbi:MAG: PepSY domain-containing protein [Nevskiales bacterium]
MFKLTPSRLPALLLAAAMAMPAQAQRIEAWSLRAEAPGMQLMHDNGQRQQRRANISREDAVRQALSEYPGKVLSVKLAGGGEFYAVKIINRGHVRVVRVPAQR